MTWERFELTGAVEDYLRYKGIDWKKEDQALASSGTENGDRKKADYGTDDHGDGAGAGSLSLR